MPFIVVYDACVFYPAPLRDLLVRVAASGIVHAKWTDMILDECFRSILKVRKDLHASQMERTRWLMNQAVRDVLVTGYEPLIQGLEPPDPDDRHVLAAAMRCGAQAIVTANTKDFPASTLEPSDLEALHRPRARWSMSRLASPCTWDRRRNRPHTRRRRRELG